jgi:hypothetical protein
MPKGPPQSKPGGYVLAASMFDVLYITDDKIVVIEVEVAPEAKSAKIEQAERS